MYRHKVITSFALESTVFFGFSYIHNSFLPDDGDNTVKKDYIIALNFKLDDNNPLLLRKIFLYLCTINVKCQRVLLKIQSQD